MTTFPANMRSPIFGSPQAAPNFLGMSPQIDMEARKKKQRLQSIGDTLTQLGIGLMGQGPSTTPQNPLQGLAAGLQGANQMAGQRAGEAMDEQRMDMAQAQFGMQQQQFNYEQQKQQKADAFEEARKAQMEKLIAGLPPDMQDAARADMDTFFKAYAESKFPKAEGPQSSLAKLAADLKAGRINQAEYDAAVRKETYIAPQAPREPGRTYTDLLDKDGNVIGQVDDRGKKDFFSNGITIGADGSVQIGGPGGGKLTGTQEAATGYGKRMWEAEKRISGLTGVDPTDFLQGILSKVPVGGNYALTPEYQQYKQAAHDWIRAKLRKESGAVISDQELESDFQTFFPQPGDKAPVIAQKADARKTAFESMMFQAGSGAAKVGNPDQYPKQAAPQNPVKPPQGPMVAPSDSLKPEDGWQ